MNIRISILAIACACLIAGCGKGLEQQLVGTWNGPTNTKLELKDGKVFVLTAGPSALGGDWKTTGDKSIHLDVKTIGGVDKKTALDKQMKDAEKFIPKDKITEARKQIEDTFNQLDFNYDKDKDTLNGSAGPLKSATFTKVKA
ncbi:hypothetical protein BH11ARM1_BH11ARM1_02360 [soil metagenome]